MSARESKIKLRIDMLTRSCGLEKGDVGRKVSPRARERKKGRKRDEQVIPAEKFRCSGQSHFCGGKERVGECQYRTKKARKGIETNLVADVSTVQADLVLVVSKRSVEGSEFTKLVPLVIVLSLGC